MRDDRRVAKKSRVSAPQNTTKAMEKNNCSKARLRAARVSLVVSSAAAYMVAYMILLLGGATLLAWDNLGFTESFTAVLTCLGNVGPGLGRLGPAGNFSPFSGFSKVVMSLLMLLGRLELMPILVMLSPRMWRER